MMHFFMLTMPVQAAMAYMRQVKANDEKKSGAHVVEINDEMRKTL